MSLFQFGFSLRREEPSPEGSVEVEILESHIPRKEDTNLGVVEHRETAAAVVNLSRTTESSQRNQHSKKKRGKYFQYSGEDRVKIGKFASENGNKKTLECFAEEFFNLKRKYSGYLLKGISRATFCTNKRRKRSTGYFP